MTIRKYISILTLMYLNEIYKIMYYKYLLSYKVLYIVDVKHSQPFKTNQYWYKEYNMKCPLLFFFNFLVFSRVEIEKYEFFPLEVTNPSFWSFTFNPRVNYCELVVCRLYLYHSHMLNIKSFL